MNKLFLTCWLCMITVPANAAEEIIITGLIGDKVLIEIDGKNHVLPEGERSPEGVKIVAIDHDKRRVTLDINGEEQVHPLDISSRRGSSSIKIVPDRSGMYRATGEITGSRQNSLSIPARPSCHSTGILPANWELITRIPRRKEWPRRPLAR